MVKTLCVTIKKEVIIVLKNKKGAEMHSFLFVNHKKNVHYSNAKKLVDTECISPLIIILIIT